MKKELINKKEFGKAALIDQAERFHEGRKCGTCKKMLSVYNPGPNCLSYCGKEMARYEI